MALNKMDDIRENWYHCTNVKELKIDGENVTSISQNTNNIIYVSKDGNDETGNGSFGNPFLTIGYANDYAITLLDPVTNWEEAIIIKVAPGKYTEHIVNSHRRIFIVGSGKDFENWPKATIIYNTGVDEEHYPLACDDYLNLSDIMVKVDPGEIFGKLINRGNFSLCYFANGYFIENPLECGLNMYFNFCYFDGDAFNLTGEINHSRFIALRKCDLGDGDAVFSTTGTGTKEIKFDQTMINSNVLINGLWSTIMIGSEIHANNGKLTFDTDGYVDIFSSIIKNGIHFISDTSLTKKVVNCIFKNTPVGEGDITANVPIEFIEYSGNHQHNGVDGEIITVSKIKNVGGGQNNYRNIHEAIKGSSLQDTIINLEGDIEIDTPLIIPAGVDIQIDGNKKWKLNTTHATTLCELSANQQLSFVNMKQILGGKKIIMNGAGSTLSFVSCGRYTEPNYVNIEMNAGDISSFVYIVKSTIIGTSAPPILINATGIWFIVDRTFLKGSSGEPAIEWSCDADSRFRAKYSTLIHGSGGGNSPLLNSDPGNGDITLSMYNCSMNAVFPPADFTNNIGNSNNTIDPQIDY